MQVTVVSLEYSLCEPHEELGDPTTSPIFNRGLKQVPVLHVFGYLQNSNRQDLEPPQQEQNGGGRQDVHVASTATATSSAHSTLGMRPTLTGSGGGTSSSLLSGNHKHSSVGNDMQSICIHVHGVFPYFFVPCFDTSISPTQFAAQLESVAINAFRLHHATRMVHHVALVDAVPFYGYSATERHFYKIYVTHPNYVSKLANLLGSTTLVGNRRYQPYEAHISYTLQFMVDFGICGMGNVEVSGGVVRRPLPQRSAACGEHCSSFVHEATVWEGRDDGGGLPEEGFTCITAEQSDADNRLNKCTTADVEVDANLHGFQTKGMEPGASLEVARRGLRQYLHSSSHHRMSHSAISDLFKKATMDKVAGLRYGTVQSCQEGDQMAGLMRQTMLKYVQARMKPPTEGDSGTMMPRQPTQGLDLCVAPTPRGSFNASLPSPAFGGDNSTTTNKATRPPQASTRLHELMHLYEQQSRGGGGTTSIHQNDTTNNAIDEDDNNDGQIEKEVSLHELEACPTFHMLDWMNNNDDSTGISSGGGGGAGRLRLSLGGEDNSDSDDGNINDDDVERVLWTGVDDQRDETTSTKNAAAQDDEEDLFEVQHKDQAEALARKAMRKEGDVAAPPPPLRVRFIPPTTSPLQQQGGDTSIKVPAGREEEEEEIDLFSTAATSKDTMDVVAAAVEEEEEEEKDLLPNEEPTLLSNNTLQLSAGTADNNTTPSSQLRLQVGDCAFFLASKTTTVAVGRILAIDHQGESCRMSLFATQEQLSIQTGHEDDLHKANKTSSADLGFMSQMVRHHSQYPAQGNGGTAFTGSGAAGGGGHGPSNNSSSMDPLLRLWRRNGCLHDMELFEIHLDDEGGDDAGLLEVPLSLLIQNVRCDVLVGEAAYTQHLLESHQEVLATQLVAGVTQFTTDEDCSLSTLAASQSNRNKVVFFCRYKLHWHSSGKQNQLLLYPAVDGAMASSTPLETPQMLNATLAAQTPSQYSPALLRRGSSDAAVAAEAKKPTASSNAKPPPKKKVSFAAAETTNTAGNNNKRKRDGSDEDEEEGSAVAAATTMATILMTRVANLIDDALSSSAATLEASYPDAPSQFPFIIVDGLSSQRHKKNNEGDEATVLLCESTLTLSGGGGGGVEENDDCDKGQHETCSVSLGDTPSEKKNGGSTKIRGDDGGQETEDIRRRDVTVVDVDVPTPVQPVAAKHGVTPEARRVSFAAVGTKQPPKPSVATSGRDGQSVVILSGSDGPQHGDAKMGDAERRKAPKPPVEPGNAMLRSGNGVLSHSITAASPTSASNEKLWDIRVHLQHPSVSGSNPPTLLNGGASSSHLLVGGQRLVGVNHNYKATITQLQRLMPHPTLPMLTTVTPRHGQDGGDDRACGMNRRHAQLEAKKKRLEEKKRRQTERKQQRLTGGAGTAASAPSASLGSSSSAIAHLRIMGIDVCGDAKKGKVVNSFTDRVLCVCLASCSADSDGIDIRSYMYVPEPFLKGDDNDNDTRFFDKGFFAPEEGSQDEQQGDDDRVFRTRLQNHRPSDGRAGIVPPVGSLFTFASEEALLSAVIDHLREADPDVLLSWDAQRQGLGYITERARIVLKMDLLAQLSRLCGASNMARLGGQQPHVHIIAEDERNQSGSDDDDMGLVKDENGEQKRKGNFAPNQRNPNTNNQQRGGGGLQDALGNDGPSRQSVLRIPGRIVLSLWRIIKTELKQKSYTLGAINKSLFGKELPLFPDDMLAAMMEDNGVLTEDLAAPAAASELQPGRRDKHQSERQLALSILIDKVTTPLKIARKLDLFVRTSELAQLYGILFFEVLSRGSQFRVESMLLRFTKPLGYLTVSPSKEQVLQQNRQEGIPLVMEPYSGYYRDPVVVLDFRSLYPSIVCAYNLCFSTCLGKVSPSNRIKVGALPSLKMPEAMLFEALSRGQEGKQEDAPRTIGSTADSTLPAESGCGIAFAPNSCMFSSTNYRQGVLPMMLEKILNTRFQVQAAMKLAAQVGDEEQRRVLDAQQMGLKLLANVTYGYTAATFTGRMPCSDIADSIVLLGRQTLERAIRTIEGTAKWNARVIYGDTDSLFVHMPGRTKEEAFDIGEDIVKQVTMSNPAPVTLKLEKVYSPCMMVVKKRYVGYAYESRDQQEPKFDAKGIETVRRDQCPATAKISEEVLRMLFDTNNADAVRSYFYEQVNKVQRGDISPTELILRREVKMGTYAKESALPPGARVALQMAANDAAALPAYGERVPYIVLNTGSDKLMNQVMHPEKILLQATPFTVNAQYYIEKHVIASLERLLHLAGIDVRRWLQTMPRMGKSNADILETSLVTSINTPSAGDADGAKKKRQTLDKYFQKAHCAVCRNNAAVTAIGEPPLCKACLSNPMPAVLRVAAKRNLVERRLVDEAFVKCDECIGQIGPLAPSVAHRRCISVDCITSFEKLRLERLLAQLNVLHQFLTKVADAKLMEDLS